MGSLMLAAMCGRVEEASSEDSVGTSSVVTSSVVASSVVTFRRDSAEDATSLSCVGLIRC